MNNFFKFLFASCLGTSIALIAMFFLGIFSIAGLAASGDDGKIEVKENSVLEIKLENPVPELTDNIEKSPFETKKVAGLHDLTEAIKQAADDDKIKGVFITGRWLGGSVVGAHSVREAIEAFKKKGKFVYAYADIYTQGGYYLASVADSVFLHPQGSFEFKGMAAQIPFMKDLFDRLDVKWQIYYAGQFKSATEPFRLDKMSEQNKMQMRAYISGIFDNILADISRTRGISVADLRNIADNGLAHSPQEAARLGLVHLGYYDEALAAVKSRMNVATTAKINLLDGNDYALSVERKMGKGKNKIAVVYAEGNINYSGTDAEQSGTIDAEHYAKIIRKLRQDDNVKAIVLRINSGGGSSLTSDIILRELQLAKAAGKTIISSFGDYAASGGYYIAMASDSIFAEPSTLTGSIGVFSMIPSFQKTFKNKLGINFDSVRTGRFAQGIDVNFDLTEEQGRLLQMQTDSTYETFLRYVSVNRHKTRDEVHAIAQGRVWLAPQAKEVGLIDDIGDLNKAIASAATKAGLSEYKIAEYPKQKSGMEQFVENVFGKQGGDKTAKAFVKSELGEYAAFYDMFKEVKNMKGVQMRMPHSLLFR